MCEVERDRNKNSLSFSGKNLTNANAMSNWLRKNEWIEKNEYPYYDNGSKRLYPIPETLRSGHVNTQLVLGGTVWMLRIDTNVRLFKIMNDPA